MGCKRKSSGTDDMTMHGVSPSVASSNALGQYLWLAFSEVTNCRSRCRIASAARRWADGVIAIELLPRIRALEYPPRGSSVIVMLLMVSDRRNAGDL